MSEELASAATELLERGYRLQLEGRTETAAVFYRRSIELAPTALAHTFLGATLAHAGRIDDAIAHCLEAIKIDPGFGNAWSDIGAYLLEKGDQGGAASYLRRALVKTRFERHHYAHANMGRVYRKQGLLMAALDEFRRALALEPRDAHAKKAIREIQRNFN